MTERTVKLSLPAEAGFARSVRMMAASLAVTCDMSVDDVEDVRMAAEEGFVYCCATAPQACDIVFSLSQGSFGMSFGLGDQEVSAEDETLALTELLLSAVCDEHAVSDDGSILSLVKRAGGAYGD